MKLVILIKSYIWSHINKFCILKSTNFTPTQLLIHYQIKNSRDKTCHPPAEKSLIRLYGNPTKLNLSKKLDI